MKYHLLAATTGLLMAFGPAATAQRLTGKVLDASTGQPVPYASILGAELSAGHHQ